MAIDDIRKLVSVGKGKGRSTDSEINNPISPGVRSTQDVDDLLGAIRTRGLEVLEREPKLPYWSPEQSLGSGPDEIDVTPAPGIPSSTRARSGAPKPASGDPDAAAGAISPE